MAKDLGQSSSRLWGSEPAPGLGVEQVSTGVPWSQGHEGHSGARLTFLLSQGCVPCCT